MCRGKATESASVLGAQTLPLRVLENCHFSWRIGTFHAILTGMASYPRHNTDEKVTGIFFYHDEELVKIPVEMCQFTGIVRTSFNTKREADKKKDLHFF